VAGSRDSPRAWRVAAICAVGMMVSVVPFHIGTFPLFLQPVSGEFGWGRAAFAISINISALTAALVAPVAGRLVDRLGGRRVLVPSIIAYGIALMAQSQLTPSWLPFCLLYFALGMAEAAAGPVAYSQVIASWFTAKRGLVLALVVGATVTVSTAVMIPVTRMLIDDHGWRTAYVVLGAIVLVLGLPAMLLLPRERPTPAAPTEAAAAMPLVGLTAGQALAGATFWLVAGGLVIHSLVVGGVRGHLFLLLTDRGLSADTATLALSMLALAGLAGNIVSGLLMDRIGSPRIALPFFVAALLGLLLLDHAPGAASSVAGAAVLGFGIGAESGLGPYFVSRYFGLRSFGQIYGCIISMFAISSGLGPYLLGLAYDRAGSYQAGLIVAEIALCVGVVLIGSLGPYVYAARRQAAAEPA